MVNTIGIEKSTIRCTCIDERTLNDIRGGLKLLRDNTMEELQGLLTPVEGETSSRMELKINIMRSRINRLDYLTGEINKIKIC